TFRSIGPVQDSSRRLALVPNELPLPGLLQCRSPLLAQSGHPDSLNQCPLSGVKRTSVELGKIRKKCGPCFVLDCTNDRREYCAASAPEIHLQYNTADTQIQSNLHIEYRFAAARIDQYVPLAKELVALKPEVILAQSTQITTALKQEARGIPIVFTNV